MPRVVPSQVVELIDRTFGESIQREQPDQPVLTLERNHAPHIAAIVDLADRLPAELLPVDAGRNAEFL